MLNTLKQLVSIPSVHGNEEQIASFVYDYAQGFCNEVVKTDDYVLAKLKGKSSSRAAVLCGHLDTVDPGKAESWHQNPHTVTLKDDRLYGLGAADMKAGVAVMLELLKHYSKNMPESDLWFVFVNNEEVDGKGSAVFVQDYKNQLEAYAEITTFILEPTPDGSFLYGCKGNLFAEVQVNGAAGHASTPPQTSEQTLHKAAKLLEAIATLEATWQKKFKDYYLGVPTITVTSMIGDSGSPNKLSETCLLVLDIRTTPQADSQVKTMLEAWATEQSAGLKYLADHCPAALSSLQAKSAQDLINSHRLKPETSLASSDQVFFTQAGIATYLLGPGDMAQAHQPNEFVYVSQLQQYFDLYIAILGQR